MKWTKVADELPTPEEPIILAGWRKGKRETAFGHYCNVFPDCWFGVWKFYTAKLDTVTYWMSVTDLPAFESESVNV